MKKNLVISLIIIFILALISIIFISKPKTSNSNRTDIYQVGDFIATIDADDVLQTNKVTATITYIGKNDKIVVYNGYRIFNFSIEEKNGTFNYPSMMPLPLGKTTLIRNKPKVEEYEFPKQIIQKLKPGKTYEFKAHAGFSFEKNFHKNNTFSLPVSAILTR
ncbi:MULTISPECIES: hypothetical protein [Bacillus cereus group]|uniref:Uncharacterized protein n=1 Tax=Bacillus thuringiensis TaxID=1428 RepID=A0A9X6ZQ73_BACTU|nr:MULTISPECIES: hypothetical protein [Bacillus cereus group]PFJ31004.1 hypothetical protein COJ15_30185 [Bacillus thuringiensis]PGP12808.1 hypothetical protein COA01_33880 [Bacillus cereus]